MQEDRKYKKGTGYMVIPPDGSVIAPYFFKTKAHDEQELKDEIARRMGLEKYDDGKIKYLRCNKGFTKWCGSKTKFVMMYQDGDEPNLAASILCKPTDSLYVEDVVSGKAVVMLYKNRIGSKDFELNTYDKSMFDSLGESMEMACNCADNGIVIKYCNDFLETSGQSIEQMCEGAFGGVVEIETFEKFLDGQNDFDGGNLARVMDYMKKHGFKVD